MKFFDARLVRIVQETRDIYSYILEIPEGYTWKAGQHAAFQVKGFALDPKDRDTRIFTIASAMEDGYLMFSTRIGEKHTSLKEVLLHQIKPGATIGVASPLGSLAFEPDKYKGILAVAGGIGVTPVRALLRDFLEHPAAGYGITVVYSDSHQEYAYADFWAEAQKKFPGLNMIFVAGRDQMSAAVDEYAQAHGSESEYLIAGSPAMNKSYTERLEALGIGKEAVKTDVFMGY
jgi:ferredoxin-NADP reductase